MFLKGYEQYARAALGCDHGAFELKQYIKQYLQSKNIQVVDFVPEYSNPIPYVDVARKVCKHVLENKNILGVLACGTGAGMIIAANRINGIHASLLYDDFSAEYARRHTNANVLVFGGRTMKAEDVAKRIDIFLSNEFEGEKYEKRNRLLDELFEL